MNKRLIAAALFCLLFIGCGAATDDDDGSEDSQVENESIQDSESTNTDVTVEVNIENGAKSEDADPLLEE